ncbi:MAG: hypothetical protein WCC87_15175 [Candidatus Korobacteraceae bacterium]
MLYGPPRLGTASFQLRFALAHLGVPILSENVVQIHEPLWSHRQPSAFNGDLEKIPFLKLESLEHSFGNYHLTALAGVPHSFAVFE